MKRRSPSTSSSTFPEHPSSAELYGWARGRLARADRERVERHVGRCSVCRPLARGARVLALGTDRPLEALPRDLRERAEDLFEAFAEGRLAEPVRRGGPRHWSASSRRLLGVLRWIDRPRWGFGLATPALAGVRSGEAVAHSSLAGKGFRIDIEWLPAGRQWTVRGRISVPAGSRTLRLVLEREDAPPRRLPVGARGFFGPLRGVSGKVRARLETEEGALVSSWLRVPPIGGPRRRFRR